MELIQYVRVARGPRKGNLRGVVVSDGDAVGWSFCRTTPQRKGDTIIPADRFNKQKGLMIARARLKHGTRVTIPHDVKPIVERMYDRIDREFPAEPVAV